MWCFSWAMRCVSLVAGLPFVPAFLREIKTFLDQQACPTTAKIVCMMLPVPTPPQRPLRVMLPFGRFEAFKILETRVQRAEETGLLQILLKQLGNSIVFVNLLQHALVGGTALWGWHLGGCGGVGSGRLP